MKKVSKTNWFTEGFDILETEGFAKITIENLCERLSITKGSFYHHFKNMDGYVSALMNYWLESNTLSIISEANKAEEVQQKKELLDTLAIDRSLKLEQTIRAWGYSNEIVKKQVQQADRIRLEYLISLEIETGKNTREAHDIATLTYAILIGLQQLFPDLSKEEQTRLNQFYLSKL